MDATRVPDGLYVSLKMVKKSDHPHEVGIGQYFMSEKLSSDPKNYCVPFLDVLSVPDESDTQIIVMPLLLSFTKIQFDTFGEVVECLRQLFEVRATVLELTCHLSDSIGSVVYAQQSCCTPVGCLITVGPRVSD
jgi:hypothetical protein